MKIEKNKATTKIVDVCPDGNECKAESKENKLKFEKYFSETKFGRGLPTKCFIVWVNEPLIKINTNKNKEAWLNFLKKSFQCLVAFFLNK